MGPMQAAAVIKESLTMGVNEGAMLSDRAFGGSDVLATSYALSQGIALLGDFDLILCGKQTTDGDTAQVGAEIAEFLGVPHVANVTKIVSAKDQTLRVEADFGESLYTLDLDFPCLITVEKDIYMPRLPSYKRRLATENQQIQVFTLDDLKNKDKTMYGLDGSPTQVEKIFPPETSSEKSVVRGSADEIATALYQNLKHHKFV
jgi:electron transfer flavoprotein beta subunit